MSQEQNQNDSLEVNSNMNENASDISEIDSDFGDEESSYKFYEEDFEPEEESEDAFERKQLSNLTRAQLQTLIEENEKNVEKIKENMALINQKLEKIRDNQCKVLWSARKTEKLDQEEKYLREEEFHLNELRQRILYLKSIKTKHKPFPLTKLPQVVLCSPWNDNFMPMVVVCNKPKIAKEKEVNLDKKFLECLTPEQFDIIEKEKRYMALECGDLEIQIAGIKGKTKVINKENNVLKAMVFQDSPIERAFNLNIPGNKKQQPCRKNGTLRKFAACPAFERKELKIDPVMEITVTSSPKEQRLSNFGFKHCQCIIDKDVNKKNQSADLQQPNNDAKDIDRSMKPQEDALKCVREAVR